MPTIGRPTKFKDEYCEMLVNHMSQGLSSSSFAGVIGVSIERISDWKERISAFREAFKRGEGLRILYWEKKLPGTSGKDAVPVIFALKNIDPEHWKDRHETALNVGVADGLGAEIAKALAKK